VIGAIVLGLLAGVIARGLTPGRTPSGLLTTLLFGLGGALLGYWLFTVVLGIGDTSAFDLGSLPGAVIGAMILLFLHRRLARP
jgi:uncharacterized membrane protein YeaQ/YmgE (transglycosylase-associated protein family)